MNRPFEDWHRLASYVVSARLAAGFQDRREFEAATGITHRTLGKLENGQRVSPDTLAVVERTVGWKPDSARMILYGGEPVPAASPDPGASDARYTVGADGNRHYENHFLQQIWDERGMSEEFREGLIRIAEAGLAETIRRNGGQGERRA